MILEKLKEIISQQLGIPEKDISMESSFVDDLGADSLDLIEIIMAVEEEFDIEISEDDSYKLQTVGDMVNYIKEAIKC
jgi:acyl carrier protein